MSSTHLALPVSGKDTHAAAIATIRGYCGWHVAPVITETLRLDTTQSTHLLLPTKNLVNVESLKLRGTELSQYEFSKAGIIRVPGGFPDTLGGLEITIKHGWDWLEVQDIISIYEDLQKRLDRDMSGIAAKTVGPFSVRYATAGGQPIAGSMLLGSEKQILDKYRLNWGP